MLGAYDFEAQDMQWLQGIETNLHCTNSMMTHTGKSGWSPVRQRVSESQLPNAILYLHFATLSMHVGVLNWCVGEPPQDDHLSLVGCKLAGFFFSKKIRFLA